MQIPLEAIPMELVSLEDPGIRLRQGFDAWDARGRFAFRTMRLGRIFQRRAAYFRVNATGRVYKVFSREKTVEVRVSKSDLPAGVRAKVIDRPEVLSQRLK